MDESVDTHEYSSSPSPILEVVDPGAVLIRPENQHGANVASGLRSGKFGVIRLWLRLKLCCAYYRETPGLTSPTDHELGRLWKTAISVRQSAESP
jgi:hypothetical protein